MRRVGETLSEIEIFLQGNDQSDSLYFRELAAEYFAACSDVARELARCREFFRAGTPLDAYRLNLGATPTLTERCRLLNFPGRNRWLSLCRLYRQEIPPAIDEEIIRKLSSDEQLFKACDMEELLKLWRKVARSGLLEDKIRVLRQLVRLSDEKSPWKTNLQQLEKAWLGEQLREAERAFREKDGKRLHELFCACTSPSLLAPARESDFQAYREMIEAWRRQDFSQKQQTLLQKIDAAYSLMDTAALETRLEEWDKLSASAYFTTDERQTRQIENARSFVREKKAAAELQKRHAELKAKLEQQLSEGEKFPELSKTFSLLEQTGLPVDPVLADQMRTRNTNYQQDERRRHIRMCLFGFLLVISLGAFGCFLYRWLETRHAISVLAEDWQKKVNDDPETVIRSFSEIGRTQPPAIAGAAELIALRDQAVQREKERREETEIIRNKIAHLRQNFPAPEMPQRREAAETLRFLHEHHQQGTPAQMQEIDDLEERFQDSFSDSARRTVQLLDEQFRKLADEENADTPEIRKEVALLKAQMDRLHTEGISPQNTAWYEAQKKRFTEAEKRIFEVETYQRCRADLRRADSPGDFLIRLQLVKDTCPKLWAQFGEKAAGQQRLLEEIAACAGGGRSFSTPGKKPDFTCSDNPYIDFCRQLMPESDDQLARTKKEVERYANERFRIYFLSIPSEKGEIVFFLKDPVVELERSGGKKLGGAIKSLSCRILLPDGSEKKMQCTVDRNAKKQYFLSPVPGPRFYVPENVTRLGPLSFEELTRWENGAEKTAVTLFWEEENRTIQPMTSLRQTDLHLLDEISSLETKSFDPLQKQQLIGHLLSLWGESSFLNREMAARMLAILHWDPRGSWMLPSENSAMRRQAAQENIRGFYQKFGAMKKSWHFCQNLLLFPPVPAGVLFLHDGKIDMHRFKAFADSSATIFVISPGAFVPVYDSWRGGEVSSLPKPVQNAVFNGQFFFCFPDAGRSSPGNETGEVPDFLAPEIFRQQIGKEEK